MSELVALEYNRFKTYVHAETQLEMIIKSIGEMEPDHSAEEILEDIKATLKVR